MPARRRESLGRRAELELGRPWHRGHGAARLSHRMSEPEPQRPRFDSSYGISDKPQGMLTWSELGQAFERSRNYWIASTRPDGRPHAAPVWGVWLDRVLYFSTGPSSVKGRNLAARPDV